jgi:hypothetical protein
LLREDEACRGGVGRSDRRSAQPGRARA